MSVYVHERIDIDGGGRGRFVELVRDAWAAHAGERYGIRLAGLWATVGSSANWPEAQVLWEMDDWSHFARARQAQYPLEDKDAYGTELWFQALEYRKYGLASLLTAAAVPVSEVRPSAEVYMLEDVQARPGGMDAYHTALRDEGVAAARERGLELFGAYRHALRPNVGMNLWTIGDWDDWRGLMEGGDPHDPSWLARCAELLDDLDGYLLAPVPDGRLRT